VDPGFHRVVNGREGPRGPRRCSRRPSLRIDAVGGLSAVDNPAGWFAIAEHSILVVTLVLSLGFIVRQVLSFRRSSGERRQQLKWLASGAVVTIVSVVLAVAFGTNDTASTLQEWADNFFWFGRAAGVDGRGDPRYRLYEIDRIISRTLA